MNRYINQDAGFKEQDFADPRMKLDHCDVSDYAKIITNKPNWTLFAGEFKTEIETFRVLDEFREYRTALKHNRELTA